MKTIILYFFLSFSCLVIPAQIAFQINGIVVGEEGKPIYGAIVLVKGSTIGVMTDSLGKFTLEISASEAYLIISWIGYQETEIQVDSATKEISVSLDRDDMMLEEVIITGFGTQKLMGKVVGVGINRSKKRNKKSSLSTEDTYQAVRKSGYHTEEYTPIEENIYQSPLS